ncbi:MAG: transglycosylase SLT domain-containing protein [Roseiflexaceae bacterium]
MHAFLGPRFRPIWRLVLLLPLLLAACDIVSAPSPPAGDTGAPTATAAPLIVSSPPPTVLPAPALLARALRQRTLGEYDAMAQDLRDLLDAHPGAAEAHPAGFYLAESYALRGRWTSAVEALRGFVDSGPQDDLYARALFLLARGYEEAGAWADAVAAYERYRTLKTPLEPYARLRQAAQQQALGQLDPAAASYVAVAASDIVRGERAGAYEKAIALYRQLGQRDIALKLYLPLLGLADEPGYRARILAEAAALAGETGAIDQARAWRREIAEQLPASAQALDAAAQLLADPQGGLAPAAAARVYSAHEQWAATLPHYDSAVAAASGDKALDLRRQRALAQRGAGDIAGALAALAAVGAEAPNSEPGRQAQLDWIQTRGQNGDTQGALDAYREFAAAYPDDARAPEALARAVILLGRLGDAEGAAQQQLDLGRRYPSSAQAHDALYEAGWYFFHAGRMPEAQAAWTANQAAGGLITAQSAFWAARAAEEAGQADARRQLLERALSAAPDSYYGARAAELLGRTEAGDIPVGAPITAAAWRTAEDWIAGWSGTPAYHADERGYPPEVAGAGVVRRAIALQDVDLQPEAIAEWNTARDAWRNEPQKLYLLARLAHEHDAPYIALKAAVDLAQLSPDKGYANAPAALRRLIFPTPYSDAALAYAQEHGLDPRMLYAMLRQESLFNAGAISWAGAHGLGQIMPATAQGIAQNLKVEGFQEADLLRPAVSIRFGAFYLNHQLAMMEGSLQGALSAYNGGPGNAQRWAGGTTVADPDLFTEGIDYSETRGYVKLVYGYYGAYKRLYRWP